ncbi:MULTISPECIES: hypothetical protein [unclassified Brevundimonas]|uniref:hypothetical protein n=1 Tax=unclassified Brevundimonas TaxID=2622653 RepID=UPI0025BB16D4|nr:MULTISPECIES: hypothetical protein [unclassified Brevundimonas]
MIRRLAQSAPTGFKPLFHAAVLSVAALLLGTAAPSAAQDLPSEAATAPDNSETSPNPAHDPQFILANLDEVSPFNLIFVVADEWKKGNKLRAAFWYYVWQIRTDAWVTGVDREEFQLVRAMMSDETGQTIFNWIAADPALMRDTVERAIGYEATLPLSKQRPEDLNEADWLAIVSKSRTDYAAELREAFANTADEEILARRRQNGLPIGTPQDIGAPLDAHWR